MKTALIVIFALLILAVAVTAIVLYRRRRDYTKILSQIPSGGHIEGGTIVLNLSGRRVEITKTVSRKEPAMACIRAETDCPLDFIVYRQSASSTRGAGGRSNERYSTHGYEYLGVAFQVETDRESAVQAYLEDDERKRKVFQLLKSRKPPVKLCILGHSAGAAELRDVSWDDFTHDANRMIKAFLGLVDDLCGLTQV